MTLAETDITSDLILRAFEVTGLRPEGGACYMRNGNEVEPSLPVGACGCAIGALALAFEVLDPDKPIVQTDTAIRALGLSTAQGWLIASGFDAAMNNWHSDGDDSPLYHAGYDAGRVLREREAVAR